MNPLGTAGTVKCNGTVHHTVIGNGNCLLSAFLDTCGDIGDATGTV